MDKVRWLREALLAVDLVEEEPERELLEPEEEELGLTRWALGASASSLQANTHRAQTAHGENRNTRLTPLQTTRVYPANCPASVLCDFVGWTPFCRAELLVNGFGTNPLLTNSSVCVQ